MADGCEFAFRTKPETTTNQRNSPGSGGGKDEFRLNWLCQMFCFFTLDNCIICLNPNLHKCRFIRISTSHLQPRRTCLQRWGSFMSSHIGSLKYNTEILHWILIQCYLFIWPQVSVMISFLTRTRIRRMTLYYLCEVLWIAVINRDSKLSIMMMLNLGVVRLWLRL